MSEQSQSQNKMQVAYISGTTFQILRSEESGKKCAKNVRYIGENGLLQNLIIKNKKISSLSSKTLSKSSKIKDQGFKFKVQSCFESQMGHPFKIYNLPLTCEHASKIQQYSLVPA